MEQKAKAFVQLNTRKYVSLEILRKQFMICWFLSSIVLVYGFAGQVLSPLIAVAIWNISFLIMYILLSNKRFRKTFRLRYLINGMSSLFFATMFFISLYTIVLVTDRENLSYLGSILLVYFIYIIILFLWNILGVHKGWFAVRSKQSFMKGVTAVATIIPSSGIIGMMYSKYIRANYGKAGEDFILYTSTVCLIFLCSIGLVNFLKYYYCVRYGINCDETGSKTSPLLEPQLMSSKARKKMARIFIIETLFLIALIYSIGKDMNILV